jgi:hypothetical protein
MIRDQFVDVAPAKAVTRIRVTRSGVTRSTVTPAISNADRQRAYRERRAAAKAAPKAA